MKRIFILLLSLISVHGFAGNEVVVTGHVNKTETLVRLMVCEDLLNMKETQIAETYTDGQGAFVLKGKLEEIRPARIVVGLEGVDLYLSPGASYIVTINIPDPDPRASYFDRQLPTLRVKAALDKDVYRQIIVSEEIIDDYVLEYFDDLYRRRQYRYIDSIKAVIAAELNVTNPYVEQLNAYRIASVKMAVDADGGKKVIKEFYDGKPVLYSNTAYMDLFKDLFANKFWQQPYTPKGFEDAFWNGPVDLKEYLDTDPFMARNPELAEMITIFNLRSIYYEHYSLRKMVVDHLKAIHKRSVNAETKKMIANMLGQFGRFAQGADAPDFELRDVSDRKVKLSDYQSTMVVLQFVEGTSRTVDHQMEVLSDLHRQWQDSVQLITVTTKDQLPVWKKRFEDSHYDWPLLNLGNEILLLENYQVHTFPEYFIILPKTKIGLAPAPNPDQTLKENVTKLLRK